MCAVYSFLFCLTEPRLREKTTNTIFPQTLPMPHRKKLTSKLHTVKLAASPVNLLSIHYYWKDKALFCVCG